jgi:hypothetical protein
LDEKQERREGDALDIAQIGAAVTPHPRPDTGRAMSQENVETVRDMLDAFNRDDLEAVIAC